VSEVLDRCQEVEEVCERERERERDGSWESEEILQLSHLSGARVQASGEGMRAPLLFLVCVQIHEQNDGVALPPVSETLCPSASNL
jgi:hypothetical protein